MMVNSSSCPCEAVTRSSSFDQNPASGAMPASAADPIRNVQNVTGIGFRNPPMSLMLLEWTAWITEPAPRKSSALKNACVNRWKNDALRPAGPSDMAATMYANCDNVEYANTRLMSSWTSAISAAPSMVIAPMMPMNCSTQASALMKTSYMRPTR